MGAGAFRDAFSTASTHEPEHVEPDSPALSRRPGRHYNIALAPEIIYSGSAFRRYLVTSQAHHQVGFLPVGSWWVYTPHEDATGSFEKVPNTREDLFGNDALDFAAKRRLVKVLRFIVDHDSEEEKSKWEEHRNAPFSTFLSEVFKAPASLLTPLHALTLSTQTMESMTTGYALPRIARHLRSIGTLGKFSALIPKYGGLDEFCQVACRACAVGGGVYVLGKGISTSADSISTAQAPVGAKQEDKSAAEVTSPAGTTPVEADTSATETVPQSDQPDQSRLKLRLKDGETITARWVVSESSSEQKSDALCKSITILSSPLSTLFPPVVIEEKPFQPGSAILVFPSGSLELPGHENLPPVHVHVHSSESGECPAGQSKYNCFLQLEHKAIMMIDFRILIYIVRTTLTIDIL